MSSGQPPTSPNSSQLRRSSLQNFPKRLSLAVWAAGKQHTVEKGSRRVHARLRVPQWELPPLPIGSPSQAAVLFDVAYAASLSHHAVVLNVTRETWASVHAVALFLLTAAPTIGHWWVTSLFLCRYDPGDLVNELILVVYMICVVGQSLTIQDCANCLLSRNLQDTCVFQQDPTSVPYYDSLKCTSALYTGYADGTSPSGGDRSPWPELPVQCWLYIFASLAPRLVHLLNALRAYYDLRSNASQARGCRAAALHVAELLLVLPFWLAALCGSTFYPAAGLFGSAACFELFAIVCEPAHLCYRALERRAFERGAPMEPLCPIPQDVGYIEKRWQRILMIALAILPAFSALSISYDFASTGLLFMISSATLAYSIKLFYFDVVDDSEAMRRIAHALESKSRRDTRGIAEEGAGAGLAAGVAEGAPAPMLPRLPQSGGRHALDYQVQPAGRWKVGAWVATNVALILCVCAVGVGCNRLLLPWDGFPERSLSSAFRARMLISLPVAVALHALCLQHLLHDDTGRWTRRWTRGRRLACRAVTGVVIAALPCLVFTAKDVTAHLASGWRCTPGVSGPPSPPPHGAPPPPPLSHMPSWMAHGDLASRTVFLLLMLAMLVLQLCLEMYGRSFAVEPPPGRLHGHLDGSQQELTSQPLRGGSEADGRKSRHYFARDSQHDEGVEAGLELAHTGV